MRWMMLVALVGCGGPEAARHGRGGGGDDEPVAADPVTPWEPVERSVPLLGGTLLAGETAPGIVFAADPAADRILAIDVTVPELLWTIDLPAGAMPFRLAEGPGAIWVTLRGSAAIARIDRADLSVHVTPACAEPRGVAWDLYRSRLWVACASGELEERDGSSVLLSTHRIDTDLRDVVPLPEGLAVSRFRSAEVLTVDPVTFAVTDRRAPSHLVDDRGRRQPIELAPQVAWRMVANPDGGVMVAHQLHQVTQIAIAPSEEEDDGDPAYGSGSDATCGVVSSVLTSFPSEGAPWSGPPMEDTALPVDVVWDGAAWAVAAAGSDVVISASTQYLNAIGRCTMAPPLLRQDGVSAITMAAGHAVSMSQEPFAIRVDGAVLADVPLRTDEPGFRMFHDRTASGLACASCHPEGGDDGHVWDFDEVGPRRTQNLATGLAATAPYHWDGEFADVGTLLDDVLVQRMGAPPATADETSALVTWLDGLPRVHLGTPADPDAVARGGELFRSAELACATCHAGDHFTSGESFDVGTGEPLQAPSLLGVGARGPWMHDGCAATLEDRFLDVGCGGSAHGGPVLAADVPDLVAYLQTL